MEWKIKKLNELTAVEMHDILKARQEVFIVEQECIYEDIDAYDKLAYHLFLEDNGEVISYLRILPKGVRFPEVSFGRVITRVKYRKKGYGGILVQKAIDFVKEDLGECEIRISAQTYLEQFYEEAGFTRVSDNYMEDNQEHCEMLYHSVR